MQSQSANSLSEAGEAALLRRIVDGDENALAVVYDRYSGLVYSVALRILRDAGLAEEVLQDIFYKFWRTASMFDPSRGSLGAWLLVCARNRAISRLRGRGAEPAEALHEYTALAPVSLESEVARGQQVARVRAALGDLPSPQRQAFELAFFEGLTHSEIAQRTGEPLGTIKTRLRSAVEFLKRKLNA